MKLSDLPNIGKELEKQLQNNGINSLEKLKETGSVKTCLLLNFQGPTCFNKLYALEGAILGIRWHNLPKDHMQKKQNELKALLSA